MDELDFPLVEAHEALLVERAEGPLERFLAHAEAGADGVGRAVVGEGQLAAGGLQLVEERVGEVAEAVGADVPGRNVELAVVAARHDGAHELLPDVHVLIETVGIDEAGRGALAGPVCAGAVAVRTDAYLSGVLVSPLSALNDSKQLTREVREELYEELKKLKLAG